MSEALHCFPVNPDGTFEVKGVSGIMEVKKLFNKCGQFTGRSSYLLCSVLHLST